jgi:hypothetical protein
MTDRAPKEVLVAIADACVEDLDTITVEELRAEYAEDGRDFEADVEAGRRIIEQAIARYLADEEE